MSSQEIDEEQVKKISKQLEEASAELKHVQEQLSKGLWSSQISTTQGKVKFKDVDGKVILGVQKINVDKKKLSVEKVKDFLANLPLSWFAFSFMQTWIALEAFNALTSLKQIEDIDFYEWLNIFADDCIS